MKKLTALLLSLMLLFGTTSLAEDAENNLCTPAMDMSLQEAAALEQDAAEFLPDLSFEPFAPDTLDKAVIGTDDRITVTSPGVYPYSAIAYLKVTGGCGCNWTASGFMVSPDCLMTAAHCVYCNDHHQSASRITMYFGYKSDKNYLYMYNGPTNYWYGTNVYDASGRFDADWDYAFIKMGQRVGDVTGWFGLSAQNDRTLESSRYEVCGYRNGAIKRSYGSAEIDSSYCITHNADTEPGYSGCPIFTGDYYVVAINVAHVTNSITGLGRYNIGRRITQELINDMSGKGMFN